MVEFDHLISKAKLMEEDKFQDFVNPVTRTEVSILYICVGSCFYYYTVYMCLLYIMIANTLLLPYHIIHYIVCGAVRPLSAHGAGWRGDPAGEERLFPSGRTLWRQR